MITTSKIINAVNKLIKAIYPDADYHVQEDPEEFERPSFFIELVTDGSGDNNRVLTDEKISIQIVYFAPVNEYQNKEKIHQLDVSDTLKNIFKKGFIKVEDRAIKVINIEGAPRNNEVYISVDFAFTEEKPLDAETYEIASEIILNT